MNKNCRLKKYFVTVNFVDDLFEIYDYAFNVWAHNKIEAKQLVLNYCKQYNIYDTIYVEAISRPFTTIINRLRKKVPDAPICERI